MKRRAPALLFVLLVVLAVAGALWTWRSRAQSSPDARVPPDSGVIQRGGELFARNCAPCHGPRAVGQNPAEPNGGIDDQDKYIAPALDGTAHAWHHPDAVLFHWVKDGSDAKDSPMRGWAGRMTDEDIWAVIRYFQSLWPDKLRQMQQQRGKGQ